jgi:hypothetical protein
MNYEEYCHVEWLFLFSTHAVNYQGSYSDLQKCSWNHSNQHTRALSAIYRFFNSLLDRNSPCAVLSAFPGTKIIGEKLA